MEYKLSLGYGAIAKTNHRINNLYEGYQKEIIIKAIPMLQFGLGPLRISGNGLTLSFLGDREKALYLNLGRNGDRYLGQNMEARLDSWFLGLGIKFQQLNFLISKDMQKRSRGQRMYLSYMQMYLPETHHQLIHTFGIEHFDKTYAEYFYGIRESEVRADRPLYHPSAYFQLTTSLIYNYNGFENWQLTQGLVIKKISDQVSKSPTMKKTDFDFSFIFGPSWVFK